MTVIILMTQSLGFDYYWLNLVNLHKTGKMQSRPVADSCPYFIQHVYIILPKPKQVGQVHPEMSTTATSRKYIFRYFTPAGYLHLPMRVRVWLQALIHHFWTNSVGCWDSLAVKNTLLRSNQGLKHFKAVWGTGVEEKHSYSICVHTYFLEK